MKTVEEVESSPIFRIIKKGVMRKYPWIKNIVSSDEESLQKYTSMLFLEADIDVIQLSEEMGWPLEEWVKNTNTYRWGMRDRMESPYLSMFFTKNDSDNARDLQNEIDSDIKRMQKSDIIPSEYKIDKTMGMSNYRYKFPTPQEEPLS